jgi:hypothetical protein
MKDQDNVRGPEPQAGKQIEMDRLNVKNEMLW